MSRAKWSSKTLLMVAFGLAACNNDLPVAPNPGTQTGSRLFSLEIQPAEMTIKVGQTGQFKAFGRDEAGVALGAGVTWKITPANLASVTEKGAVRGLREGVVSLIATTQTPPREARATVRIVPTDGKTVSDDAADRTVLPNEGRFAGVQGVILPAQARVTVGRTWQFQFQQGPPGAPQVSQARWKSLNPDKAAIGDDGLLRALKPGLVTIEATSVAYEGLVARSQVTLLEPVSVAEIRGIRITPADVTMRVGETFWLLADVSTWNGESNANVRWETGDARIVTVSETGQLTARAPGRTTVTAAPLGEGNGSELVARVPVTVLNASRL